jgi:16S rRNA (adenine1518-N6/adenine1519-N6)-dimethyltransferase
LVEALLPGPGHSRLREIKAAVKRYGLSLHRRLGQNFLVDLRPAQLMAQRARTEMPGDDPLAFEIGTGMGQLTECLVAEGFRVVSLEIDAGLCALARDRLLVLDIADSVTLMNVDALDHGRISPEALEAVHERLGREERFAFVSNLPYSGAAPAIAHFAVEAGRMALGIVMVQREVGERMCSEPGDDAWGSFGLLCRACFDEVELLRRVKPGAFYPRPRVESAVVLFRPGGVLVDVERRKAFSDYAKRIFSQRRRVVRKAAGKLGFTVPEGVSASERVEKLSVEEHLLIFGAGD